MGTHNLQFLSRGPQNLHFSMVFWGSEGTAFYGRFPFRSRMEVQWKFWGVNKLDSECCFQNAMFSGQKIEKNSTKHHTPSHRFETTQPPKYGWETPIWWRHIVVFLSWQIFGIVPNTLLSPFGGVFHANSSGHLGTYISRKIGSANTARWDEHATD